MPSANFSNNKKITAQWYVPAVRGTGFTDKGNTWSRWEKLLWVANRKLELPCPQDTASHVSARIPLAGGLWDWPLCDSGFREYWVSSAVVEFTYVYLSELATGQHSQEPFGTSSRAILLACPAEGPDSGRWSSLLLTCPPQTGFPRGNLLRFLPIHSHLVTCVIAGDYPSDSMALSGMFGWRKQVCLKDVSYVGILTAPWLTAPQPVGCALCIQSLARWNGNLWVCSYGIGSVSTTLRSELFAQPGRSTAVSSCP